MQNAGFFITRFNECEVRIDESIPRITDWNHMVRRVVPNMVTRGIDLSIRTSNSRKIRLRVLMLE